MGTFYNFYKIFKINALTYGVSGTGYIDPLVGTESILVKCEKWHPITSHIIQY